MTTSSSPIQKIKAEATKIAQTLKQAERGQYPNQTFRQRIEESKLRGIFVVGIAMDDKIIKVEIPWDTIKATPEKELTTYIVDLMQGKEQP